MAHEQHHADQVEDPHEHGRHVQELEGAMHDLKMESVPILRNHMKLKCIASIEVNKLNLSLKIYIYIF